MKNHTDVLIFHTAICAGASQIAIMAEEKPPSRISLRPVANAPECRIIMLNEQCKCEKPNHVHEITGSTKIFNECSGCHNHRFCTVSGEAVYTKDNHDHYHEVKFRTDFSDGHFHEFCGKTSGAIEVGNGKHIHFLKDFTEEADGHKHEFQAATLIDSPTDFKRKQ